MDSDPAATRTMRVVLALIVAGAVIFMAGVLAALAGAALRLTSGHHRASAGTPWSVGTAENIAVIGLAIGLGALVLVLPAIAVARRARPLVRAPAPRPRRRAAHGPRPVAAATPPRGQGPLLEPEARPLPDWLRGYSDDGWRPGFRTGPQPDDDTGPLPAIQPGADAQPLDPLPPEPAERPIADQPDELGRRHREMIREYFAPAVVGQQGEQ